jgi:CRISPR system Cascade subunit CasE
MYLSELYLNPRSRDARRDLGAPYEIHRTITRAFPDGEPEGNRLLFRVDEKGGIVLVQSSTAEPDWTHLPEDYCRLVRGPKPVAPDVAAGALYAFRLHANPTVKRQGKRLGLAREEEQIAWLRRKGESGGFMLLHAVAAPYQLGGQWHGAPSHEHKASIPHLGVRFDGVLRATDPATLLGTIASGIGSAKSFGFGLLTLARLE